MELMQLGDPYGAKARLSPEVELKSLEKMEGRISFQYQEGFGMNNRRKHFSGRNLSAKAVYSFIKSKFTNVLPPQRVSVLCRSDVSPTENNNLTIVYWEVINPDNKVDRRAQVYWKSPLEKSVA